MKTPIDVRFATLEDIPAITAMEGGLLQEIMNAIGSPVFNFDANETRARLIEGISQKKYFVLIAFEGGRPIGFAALYEGFAVYAEGAFGTIAELYVAPAHRSSGVGAELIAQAKTFAVQKGWKRLEVTTPPLPPFEKTLAFYEREGFAVTGGRKLKTAL